MATFAEAYREAREAVDKKKEIRHLTAGLPVMRPVRGNEGLKAQLVARGGHGHVRQYQVSFLHDCYETVSAGGLALWGLGKHMGCA